MVPERDVDPAELYEQERHDFVGYLRSLPEELLTTEVLATPGWSVRDVLAHLVGITSDLNAQRFGDGDADEWTTTQIAARRDDSVDDLAREWDLEAPTFEAGLRLFGYEMGAHYLGDLLQHGSDVRTALGRSPQRDDETLAVVLDFYLMSFEQELVAARLGAVDVIAGPERWRLGAREGDVVASVAAPRFELFRALGGRRTMNEILSLTWTGDVEQVAPLVSCYPMPSAPLDEA